MWLDKSAWGWGLGLGLVCGVPQPWGCLVFGRRGWFIVWVGERSHSTLCASRLKHPKA